ncbi:MAG: FecR domain-containing protein [Candidatus Omnitrophica bacterium]|nr:FecR domain-containing protein [Candidatus Omnitrophota bacterium]
MGKVLSSHADVEMHLRLLGESQFPQTDLAFDRLVPLIWQKIETPRPLSFSWTPAYASLLLVLILIFGLWAYQMGLVSKPFAPAREPSVTRGIVLETGGIPAGEVQSTVGEGDRLVTGEDSWLTFYVPGAGYFHLAQNSILSLQNSSPLTGFKFSLESGRLYSKLPELQKGITVSYETPYGAARVFGTDFVLGAGPEEGMKVEVLNGMVEVEMASVLPKTQAAKVETGTQALISPDLPGHVSVTKLEAEQRLKLESDFESIFRNVDASSSGNKKEGAREPTFRILSREEV